MPAYDYTTTMYFTRTSTRVGGSQASFSRVTRTGDFIRYRAGTPSTRESTYARSYMTAQGEMASTEYSRTFVGDFIGDFTNSFTRSFTRTRTETYTGYYSREFIGHYSRDYTGYYSRNYAGTYSRDFIGNYIGDFTGNYSRGYTGAFTGNYTRDYAGNYVVEYTRTSTRTSTYTRTLSGGSGETPTYTPTATNSEYGLVVYGPDGVTEIINPNMRVTNLAHYESKYLAGGASYNITIQDADDPSKVSVILSSRLPNVTMSISGNTVTITNNYSTPKTATIIALRLS